MRTTITLDDDVASMINQLKKNENKPFKQIVNELLRAAITGKKSAQKQNKKYSTPVVTESRCLYPNLDNISDILAVAEKEDYK